MIQRARLWLSAADTAQQTWCSRTRACPATMVPTWDSAHTPGQPTDMALHAERGREGEGERERGREGERETETERKRQRERKRKTTKNRQRDRATERQRDSETDRERAYQARADAREQLQDLDEPVAL
eukprot:1746784-Rhodomonas_salina.1